MCAKKKAIGLKDEEADVPFMRKKFIANNRTHILLCTKKWRKKKQKKKSFCRWEFLIWYDVYMAKVKGIFQYVASCLKEIYCRFCYVQLLLQYYFLLLISPKKNIYFLTFHHKAKKIFFFFVCFMPSNHHFPVPILCHSSNKSVKYLSLCTCTENQIYISENYTGEMRKREKMKNCVICLMESFTPLFTAWTWQTLFNHFQFVSAIALHHLTYFHLISCRLSYSHLCFALLCCASSSSSSRFPFNEWMEMKKGNVFYEISNAMNE